jgi:hypothetical protein
MATQYLLTKDLAGYNGFGLKPTDTVYSASVTSATDTTLTVPAVSQLGTSYSTKNARLLAIITIDPAATVWFALNNIAGVPAGATFASTNSELINPFFPVGYEVSVGDVLHFYNSGTTTNDISVKFYWIQS